MAEVVTVEIKNSHDHSFPTAFFFLFHQKKNCSVTINILVNHNAVLLELVLLCFYSTFFHVVKYTGNVTKSEKGRHMLKGFFSTACEKAPPGPCISRYSLSSATQRPHPRPAGRRLKQRRLAGT